MSLHQNPYIPWTLEAATISADIAAYCDHVEHVEPANPSVVAHRAADLRELSFEIADYEGVDILDLYARRLGEIAATNTTCVPKHSFKSEQRVREAKTLHELQIVQTKHNRSYHPDVAGLSRADQLRHFSVHVSKLVGALAEQASSPSRPEAFINQQLPDMLIMGILIGSATNDRLPNEPVPPIFFD